MNSWRFAPARIGKFAVACLALFLLVVGCGGEPSPETYTVSGTIIDDDGDPIPAVEVSFSGADSPATISTDEDGLWEQTGLWGDVTITVSDPAYTFTNPTRNVSAGATDVDFDGAMKTCNSGDRTDPNDPCIITRIKQVQKVQEMLDGHYALGDDVDATSTGTWSGGAGFEPLGSQATRFTGTLDGRDFKIEGLVIERSSIDDVGLFGHIGTGGEVSNLNLVDGSISGGDYVGAFAGVSRGSVTNSHNSGSVTGTERVGGLVGSNYATIAGSRNSGDIEGSYRVGGVAGANTDSITSSSNEGEVTGDRQVGGIAGYSIDATVEDSQNSGAVTGIIEDIGGVVGLNERSVISGSSNSGAVEGEENVGGVAGQNLREASQTTEHSIISGSHNSGSVTGTRSVGGVAGLNYFGEIEDSYSGASGAVSGIKNVGGVVGWSSSGIVQDSHNSGNVTGVGSTSSDTAIGGVVGFSYFGKVYGSHNSGHVEGPNLVGGVVGYNQQAGAVVATSFNIGTVKSSGNAGGLAGSSFHGTIEDSYNLGSVTSSSRAGGVLGLLQGAGAVVQRTYNAGVVDGTGVLGGVVALRSDGSIDDSYFDQDVSPGMVDEATYGQSTAAMMQQSTYEPAWDFSTVWSIDEGNDYPDLIGDER